MHHFQDMSPLGNSTPNHADFQAKLICIGKLILCIYHDVFNKTLLFRSASITRVSEFLNHYILLHNKSVGLINLQ